MAQLNANARNTASDVEEIFDTVLTEPQLNNWINMAAETTDDVEDADTDGEMSDARLKLIEANVAAAYATAQDPRVTREQVGDGAWSYDRTEYWDTAVSLDTTGSLAQDSGKPRASIHVLDGRNIED